MRIHTYKKNKLIIFLLSSLFFFGFTSIPNAAPNWQPNPSLCPSTDSSNFPGQNCIPVNICGDNSGTAQCFDTSTLLPPSSNSISTSTSQYRSGGGYVVNCNATIDGAAPYCDNSGNFWCNPDTSCYGGGNNRETICTANLWSSSGGSFSCGGCLPTHLDCGGDSRCEIQKNTTDYPTGGNNHYGDTCLESDAKCDTNYFDCDGSGITVGNGCEQRSGIACTQGGLSGTMQCTLNAGGTCTNGTNNYTCTCVVPKQYFETGTQATYSTNDPLLWGQQFGSGPLIQFGNSTTEDLFILNNDGSIQIANILAPTDPTNLLYSIGGSLYWNGGIIGSSGAGIWDTDSDTGIQVEATPDDDRVRMYTDGIERFRIDEFGRMKLSSDWSSSSSALFEVGAGSEPSTFAVSADPAYLNIATFRDVDGENIFRAMGSLSGDDALVTFGDYDGAYGGAAMSIHSGSGFGHMQITEMELRFRENANLNSDYIGFKAPSTIDNSIIWTLPNEDGNVGEALITNGSGVLSWSSVGSNITTDNGLTLTGDNVQLGGTLSEPFTSINFDGNSMTFDNIGYFYLADPIFNASIEHDGGALSFRNSSGAGLSFGSGYGIDMAIYDDSENIIVYDNRTTTKGIEYDSDYSAGFTNRSLVDKEYVDNAVLSGSNNIYTSDGSLTGARILDADGYNFNIVNEFISYSINSDSSGIVADDGSSRARFDIEPWFFQLYAQSQSDYSSSSIVGGNSGVLRLSANSNGGIDDALYFDLTSDSIKVITNSSIFPGITYDKDYSANFTNRSLVDKGYVDSHMNATTLQGATDNSIAQDGYVYFDTGAALFEDDGGAFKIEAQTGGYQVEIASAEGSRLYFKSDNGPGNPAEIKIIDNRILVDRHGIEYEDDYSAGYTNRSLVDKEYVDNLNFVKLSGTDVGSPATGAIEFQDYTGKIINVDSGTAVSYSSYIFAEDGNFNIETHDSTTNFIKSLRFGGDTTTGVTLYGNDPGFVGFMYDSDYSANYTNRSIVDKEYVDTAIGDSTITAGNGLSLDSGSVGLGGSLNQMTYIDHNGYDFVIREFAGETSTLFAGDNFKIKDYNNDLEIRFGIGSIDHAGISFDNPSGSIHNIFTADKALNITSNQNDFTGLVYDKDYSASFVNRSLIDKAYVDSAISSVDQQLQKNSNILSPQDSSVYQIGITNNSASTLTGFKATNTNDTSNYAGSILELKGSGADFTNNVYFGKYGNAFYVPSWAGNGVLATDKNLVISAVGATSSINFQVGGGYASPTNKMSLSSDAFNVDVQSISLGDITAEGDVVTIQDSNGICTLNPGSGASWSCSSDRSLKHDIEDLSIGLDIIMALRPTTFKMNVDNTEQTGFIAQEVESVMPALVSMLPGGYLGVKEGGMIPYIVRAIQEQQNQINILGNGLLLSELDRLAIDGGLIVEGEVSFGEDTIGEAMVPAGESIIEIVFSQEYKYQPVITITKLTAGRLDDYFISDITLKGFTINIEPEQENDVYFSWHSFSSKEGNLSFSEYMASLDPIEYSDEVKDEIEVIDPNPQPEIDEDESESEETDENGEEEPSPMVEEVIIEEVMESEVLDDETDAVDDRVEEEVI
jgi:hypothetical protein